MQRIACAIPILATSGGTPNPFPANSTAGYQFSTTLFFQVNALGVQDFPSFSAPVEAGIWDSVGNLLASVNINPTDTLVSGYRYASILSPIVIGPGTYTLGIFTSTNFQYSSNNGITTLSGITYAQGPLVATSTSLARPTDSIPLVGNGFFGPNLDVTQVPELDAASACMPMFTLTLGLAATRRRRATKAA